MDKCNWAEHNYEKGFRATTIEGVRGFSDQTGWFKSLVDTLLHENIWIELRNVEISRTWKERHAKGVPVKMTSFEFDNAVKVPGPGLNEGYQHGSVATGIPRIRVYDRAVGKGLNPKLIATFCNFRYKTEWMEKKGGANV